MTTGKSASRKTVAIITASDRGYNGTREDISGQTVRDILEQNDYEVIAQVILPDERDQLSDQMKQFADQNQVNLIVTTGGTGFAKRDCTPEATLAVIERAVPGIPEAMRAYSMQITKRAMLSRGVAGIRGETLIVNLPGSPKAVQECLEYIIPELAHGIEILIGTTGECAR